MSATTTFDLLGNLPLPLAASTSLFSLSSASNGSEMVILCMAGFIFDEYDDITILRFVNT